MATEAEIEAAARIIWTDYAARYGGSWEGQPEGGVTRLQVRASARAALNAAEAVRAKDPMHMPFHVRDGETVAEAWKRTVAECEAAARL